MKKFNGKFTVAGMIVSTVVHALAENSLDRQIAKVNNPVAVAGLTVVAGAGLLASELASYYVILKASNIPESEEESEVKKITEEEK